MFRDTVLKIGMVSICPSILFGFTYCNDFASSWWEVGAGMGVGLFICRLDMCGDIEFVVVKVGIGIQEGDSFLAEFMSKLIVGCILFILSMNFWNSLIG